MRRFCASYVESSLKRGGWNWVKSAKDNIGQGPRIIGSWSLEIPLTKSHQRSGLKSQRILRDSPLKLGQICQGYYWTERVLQDPHWKLPSSYCVRSPIVKFSQIEHLQYLLSPFCSGFFLPISVPGWILLVFRLFDHSWSHFLFCEFCDQEKQETLPLGLSSALPARGQFVWQHLTRIQG